MSACFHDYPRPDGPGTVYVFPHAGGFASFYQPLAKLVAASATCRVWQYAQRGERHRDLAPATMPQLVDEIVAVIEGVPPRPGAAGPASAAGAPATAGGLVLFGHSLGASVAFETALALGRRVTAVVVSGRLPPAVEDDRLTGPFDDASLLRRLARYDAKTTLDLARQPDLRELIMPAIRADMRLLSTYRAPGPDRRLDVPLIVLSGRDDPAAPPASTSLWERATTAACHHHEFPGGHFFLEQAWPQVARLVVDAFDAPSAPDPPKA